MKQGQQIEQEFKNEAASHHSRRRGRGLEMIHRSKSKVPADDDYRSFENDVNSQRHKSTTGYSQISRQFTRRIRLSKNQASKGTTGNMSASAKRRKARDAPSTVKAFGQLADDNEKFVAKADDNDTESRTTQV